ncbi:MAG: uracil phosphoribosyltransferase [Bacteroidales bacterium]
MKLINLTDQDSLLSQYMSELRNIDVQGDRLRFRANVKRIGAIMAYELSKGLTFEKSDITTPLGVSPCSTLNENIVLGTILRAGLPFHDGFLQYFDNADNAFVSAYRKHTSDHDFEVHIEYIASPSLEGKTLIIVDPMLATGISMELALEALYTKGKPAKIIVASVIASQQAIDHMCAVLPEGSVVMVGDIDAELNDHSYIVPGLGDAGDLLYGEK